MIGTSNVPLVTFLFPVAVPSCGYGVVAYENVPAILEAVSVVTVTVPFAPENGVIQYWSGRLLITQPTPPNTLSPTPKGYVPGSLMLVRSSSSLSDVDPVIFVPLMSYDPGLLCLASA